MTSVKTRVLVERQPERDLSLDPHTDSPCAGPFTVPLFAEVAGHAALPVTDTRRINETMYVKEGFYGQRRHKNY